MKPQSDTEEHRWGMGGTVNGRRGVKVQMTKLKIQRNAKKAMFKGIPTFEVIDIWILNIGISLYLCVPSGRL